MIIFKVNRDSCNFAATGEQAEEDGDYGEQAQEECSRATGTVIPGGKDCSGTSEGPTGKGQPSPKTKDLSQRG